MPLSMNDWESIAASVTGKPAVAERFQALPVAGEERDTRQISAPGLPPTLIGPAHAEVLGVSATSR